ncbi:glycoside hydrolase family 5 protein [Nibricoccus sp. IMCC34717]|uniref:glycoside hydrolase family 5 protein n=1 Tax=Nibricoccus sp. IMCC34717 TaxID=3034021 RepID=UPI00384ABE7A
MKSLIAVCALAALLCSSLSAATSRNPSNFRIFRGTNVSHWLSQDFGWGPKDKYITEEDLKFIAKLGFDHIRLPVDEHELWTESGQEIESGFAYLDKGIGWARANGLRVIVDLHTVRSHHFNAEHDGGKNSLFDDPAAQKKFVALWRSLANRLQKFPNADVAYEIMNEPTAKEAAQWNHLVKITIAEIRRTEPERVIVVGANRWQVPTSVPDLVLPENDPNLIISIHFYAPMALTHYRAHWTALKTFKGKISYPGKIVSDEVYAKEMKNSDPTYRSLFENAGSVWNKDRFKQEFDVAIAVANKLKLDLYCGEFGCMVTVDPVYRLPYYRDIVHAFEESNIAWSNWDYKSEKSFGIVDWKGKGPLGGPIDQGLVDALLKR